MDSKIYFDDWDLDISSDESHNIIFTLKGKEVYRVWLNDVVDGYVENEDMERL